MMNVNIFSHYINYNVFKMDYPLGFNIKNNTFKELATKLPFLLAFDVWLVRDDCDNWIDLVTRLELSEEKYILLHEQYGLPYPTPLNINKCSYLELLSIPEIGPIRARNILQTRPFINYMDIVEKNSSDNPLLMSKHLKYFTFTDNRSVVNIKSTFKEESWWY